MYLVLVSPQVQLKISNTYIHVSNYLGYSYESCYFDKYTAKRHELPCTPSKSYCSSPRKVIDFEMSLIALSSEKG